MKSNIWYHGSPYGFTILHKGSTITQNIALARVFSHKPTCVSMGDDGEIQHNGTLEGYLYIIDEPINETDIEAHPRTTMEQGLEWLTKRELKVRLLENTKVLPVEYLSEEAIQAIKNQENVK